MRLAGYRKKLLHFSIGFLAAFAGLSPCPTSLRANDASIPNVARLGRFPDWTRLEKFQQSMTRTEFVYLLNHCYARKPADYAGLIEVLPDRVLIAKQSNNPKAGYVTLWFKNEPDQGLPPITYWRDVYDLNDLPAESAAKPLHGVKIAIDPGHIGGNWVKWDDRHFQLGRDTIEIREGEMTLRVARILERDLTTLGASVFLTRLGHNPVTEDRVELLQQEARSYLVRKGRLPTRKSIADTAKAMFAISSEIRCRAVLINKSFQPDIALCLHFNASPWGRRPSFRSANHLHLLINGAYSRYEISEDDTRCEMILRILQRVYYRELALAEELAETMARETRLPAFHYGGGIAKAVSENRYIWARNLLANRMFMCPVVFFEPYCMNHREIHARVQAGEYRGLREFGGVYRKNIYQEYADGVTSGLVNYFRNRR